MIAVVYESRRYRELLNSTVRDGWTVIEIGPHTGKATRLYAARACRTIAVDIGAQSESAMEKLLERHKGLRFVRGDARNFETVKRVREITGSCDLLAVDMGGGRFPDTVFKVWAVWSGVFSPRHSIIRNRGIAEFLQRAKVMDASVVRDFPENGWLSTWGRSVPSKLRAQMEEFGLYVRVK